MTTYIGVASSERGPVGRVTISLGDPDNGRRIVTGNIKAGTKPSGLTGFSGDWTEDGSFQASGQNTVSNDPSSPFDDVHLVADVAGIRQNTMVIGTILATVNGDPHEWTFEAYDIMKDPRAEALKSVASRSAMAPTPSHALAGPMLAGDGPVGVIAGPVKKAGVALLYAIPVVAVVGGGVALAGLIGKKMKERG